MAEQTTVRDNLPDPISDVLPDTNDLDLEVNLCKLAVNITNPDTDAWEETVHTVETREDAVEAFHNLFGITLDDYIGLVAELVDKGMTFSAARSHALDGFTNKDVLGTHLFHKLPAELTDVGTRAHDQLISDGDTQLTNATHLHYMHTMDRPVRILSQETITGYSGTAVGQYSSEINSDADKMRIILGEFLTSPQERPSDRFENSAESLPQYVVITEYYTENGVVEDPKERAPPTEHMGSRLHSVNTDYCTSLNEAATVIEETLQYAPHNTNTTLQH